MLKRTFHKWKWNIFDTFGLSIDCEKTAPYRYYIANVEDMKDVYKRQAVGRACRRSHTS